MLMERARARPGAAVHDPLTNPYAPPEATPVVPHGVEGHGRSRSSYEGERRNGLVAILLCVVTLGVYPTLWYLRRARFIDSLDANKKVGALPWLSLALVFIWFILACVGAERTVVQSAE